MSIYLFAFFVSFITNLILIIPFIDFLYKVKFQRAKQETRDAFDERTPIFDKLHARKVGIPVGGGVLISATTLVMFISCIAFYMLSGKKIVSNYPSVIAEIKIVVFTLISFSLLGLYDDLKKKDLKYQEIFDELKKRGFTPAEIKRLKRDLHLDDPEKSDTPGFYNAKYS